MGKQNGPGAGKFRETKSAGSKFSRDPSADMRRNTGRHQASVGRAERKAMHNSAVAKRQDDPLPLRKVLLGLCAFAAAGSLLYLLMAWIAEDDEDDVVAT